VLPLDAPELLPPLPDDALLLPADEPELAPEDVPLLPLDDPELLPEDAALLPLEPRSQTHAAKCAPSSSQR